MTVKATYRERLLAILLNLEARSPAYAAGARLAAGLLLPFGLLPAGGRDSRPGGSILLAAVVLLFALSFLAGPLLGVMQPVFAAAGAVSGDVLLTASVAGVLGWRYRVGRTYLAKAREAVS